VLPSSFYRKDPSLPAERRYFGGEPPEAMRLGSAWPGADIRIITETSEIAPGIHLIALVSDKPGTMELRELSLAVETPDGLVLVVGCSHPGIGRIVERAAAISPRILLLAGGFHMLAMPDAEVETVATSLHDRFNVSFVAPGHCTGEPAFAAFARVFDDRYLYAGLGSTVTVPGAANSNTSSASAGSMRPSERW
jgi:7,8-dihydropterin-6-yl-methyl-4-(beta-D-ribofuranosyl)aminobenzene 5'-phosphate synthase